MTVDVASGAKHSPERHGQLAICARGGASSMRSSQPPGGSPRRRYNFYSREQVCSVAALSSRELPPTPALARKGGWSFEGDSHFWPCASLFVNFVHFVVPSSRAGAALFDASEGTPVSKGTSQPLCALSVSAVTLRDSYPARRWHSVGVD